MMLQLKWLTCAVNGCILGLSLWRHEAALACIWGLAFVLTLLTAINETVANQIYPPRDKAREFREIDRLLEDARGKTRNA